MKNVYLTIIFAAIFSFAAFSQIPNSGFENWTTIGSYEEPVGWTSFNYMTGELGLVTCEKGSPGSPGNYFLKLTSKDFMSVAVISGFALSGTMDQSGESEESFTGFPFTQRPANFAGKWQHMVYGTSQGMVAVLLTKWDPISQTRINVASLDHVLSGMAMSWANFSLPLTYYTSDYPDTCLIILMSSGDMPTVNDFLYVDNLSFTGSVSGIKDNAINVIQVYPNPAKDQITIEHSFEIDGSSTLLITNILGEQLLTESINSTSEKINIESLQNGIYFVTLKSKRGIATQKLIINR